MSKSKGSVADLPASLPPHAVAECEADPAQREWWLRWAAVGDAKDVMREATARLAVCEAEWRECVERAGGRRPSDPCECGEHAAMYLRIRDDVGSARQAVEAAIVEFKGG